MARGSETNAKFFFQTKESIGKQISYDMFQMLAKEVPENEFEFEIASNGGLLGKISC